MTDLHFALLILAAVLLVLLVGYNKWQERRALRQLGQSLRGASGEIDDALLETPAIARVEPVLAGGAPAVGPVDPLPSRPAQEVAVPPAADARDAAPAEAAAAPAWVEDPMIDWVLELRCAHAVDGVAVFDAAVPLARLDAPLPVFLVAWDARRQQWVQPDRFGFYTELLVATQLASRRHRLDEGAAARFIGAIQQVATALDADFDAPDVAAVVRLAEDLDRLCARFDVQIGLTLNALRGVWDPPQVARAAAAAKLVPTESQRWEAVDDGGATLFALRAESLPTDRLLLEIDVPLAPVRAEPLRAMIAAADRLAAELGAQIVDDNGRPIDPAALAAIAAELDALYAQMRAAGIEPGAARARRLYG